MPTQTMTDKELSKIVCQPNETTRRQLELNNGAKLRYLFFKDFTKEELQKRMDDTISKHGLILYTREEILKKFITALQKDKHFEEYIFTASKKEIIAEAQHFRLKKEVEARMRAEEIARKSPGRDVSIGCTSIDIYAYNPNTQHKCFFTFTPSRMNARNLTITQDIYNAWDIDYTAYAISFGAEQKNRFANFGMEAISVSELLGEDAEKIIIV